MSRVREEVASTALSHMNKYGEGGTPACRPASQRAGRQGTTDQEMCQMRQSY